MKTWATRIAQILAIFAMLASGGFLFHGILAAQTAPACQPDSARWGPGHCEVQGASTWDQVGAQFNLPSSGSGTDGTTSTRGDRMQAAEGVAVSTSDTAQAGAGRVLHVPRPGSPPPPTTTSTSSTTTSTSSSTTTTSSPTTTTTSTTSTTAPPPTSTTTSTTSTTTTPPTGTGEFFEPFETAAGLNRFDFGISGQNPGNGQPAHVWPGDHDMGCGPADSLRDVHMSSAGTGQHAMLGEFVWFCAPGNEAAKGHFMTSLDTSGYNILWFSPRGPSNGYFRNVRRVCWDQSVSTLGGGKWTELLIVTRAEVERASATAGRLELGLTGPGFQDPNGPTTGVMLDPNTTSVGARFFGGNFDYYRANPNSDTNTAFPNGGQVEAAGPAFDHGFTYTDKSPRFTHCLIDNENGTVTITQQRPGGEFFTETLPRADCAPDGQPHAYNPCGPQAIPDGDVRIVLKDDTYDGIKHGGILDRKTWHWDNVRVVYG